MSDFIPLALTATPATPGTGAPQRYNRESWHLEPTHFTTNLPDYLERLRKHFTDCGVEVQTWDPSRFSGTLRYQTPGGINSCTIKLTILTAEDGSYIIEFMRFDGDHFVFNPFFDMFRRRFQGLPQAEVAPAPTLLPTSPDLVPLDPETARAEWDAIVGYFATPLEGLRMITKLARQGVMVPTDVLSLALQLPQTDETRPCIIALLALDNDYTGIETVVRTALTGFVPYFAEMRARYEEAATMATTTPPEPNQLYINRGEIDLQRYCQMVDRLSPDLIGDALPAVMEVLEIARDCTTWIQTQEIAVETFSRLTPLVATSGA